VIAAAALVVLPFTLRNAGRGGEPVLISYNAGINFFIGNNPDPRTTIGIRPDLGWKALSSEPGRLGIRGYAAGSNYFAGKSLAWAAREPGAFALLQGRKVAEFLGGTRSSGTRRSIRSALGRRSSRSRYGSFRGSRFRTGSWHRSR
jgi:hypothetical protein